jgi:hypothetical protein
MRRDCLAAVLVAAILWPGGAAAADLSAVDRSIKKEPAYRSRPKYCLLVFGPAAKHRVWVVLDGEALYVDKNGNGDLTDKGERFAAPGFKASSHPAHEGERSIEVGELSVGGLTHAKLTVAQTRYRRKVDDSRGLGGSTREEWQGYLDSIHRRVPGGVVYTVSLDLDMRCYGLFGGREARRVNHFAWIDQQGHLAFADRAGDAPVIHFGGPLTLRITPDDALCRGKDVKVTLCLGSRGLGRGAFATMCYDLVPKDVHPVVEFSFPGKMPGDRPMVEKYTLKERC